MERYLHSLPDPIERSFKRDQVQDILKDLKPQLDTWGIVKIPVKGRYIRALLSLVELGHYCALIGPQLKAPKAPY